MNIVSYAQNFEDVMLWRSLSHVGKGFYIDIGAQDPVIDSVSLAFYEHGWRGVHVEPTEQYSAKLRSMRPDECVRQVAVGGACGEIMFYEFSDTGLSTADPDIAARHQQEGFAVTETKVNVVTLDSILKDYESIDIHWLKVDVEGFEKNVLESWAASPARPWVLVIESTKPMTEEDSYMGWEEIVLNKGYHFAYFDGLNRFYVHEKHSDLLPNFSRPPNIFDGFMLSGSASQPFTHLLKNRIQQVEGRISAAETQTRESESRASQADAKAHQAELRANQAEVSACRAESNAEQAESKAQQAELRAQQAELRAQQAELRAQQAEARVKPVEGSLNAIYSSRSWRLTAPLRWVAHQARTLGGRGTAEVRMRRIVLVRYLVHSIKNRPSLCEKVIRIAKRFGVYDKLRVKYQSWSVPIERNSIVPDALQALTPRGRDIFYRLKAAVKGTKGGVN